MVITPQLSSKVDFVYGFLVKCKEAIICPFVHIVDGCDDKPQVLPTFNYLSIELVGNHLEYLVIVTTCTQYWYVR
jgi:hypothetical protein